MADDDVGPGPGSPDARRLAEELRAAVVAERQAEARKLALVCEFADVYRSVIQVLELPGGPRLTSAGADGTIDVDDFLIEELHPLLGVSAASAWSLVRSACNLRDRHPRVWRLVQDGSVPAWQGRQVAEQCETLCRDAAAWVDERIAASLMSLSWPRARRRLAGLIVSADPELAAEQAQTARRGRFVKIDHNGDGTSFLWARLATPDAVMLQETIRSIAQGIQLNPEYTGSSDEARADALGQLALPDGTASDARSLPTGTLVVHLSRNGVANTDSVASLGRVEGPNGADDIGPVLLDQVRELLGHRQVRVMPVIDLADDPAVDSYEIPDRIRTLVELRDGRSRFPYGDRAARGCDLDHTVPWRADGTAGQTRASNLGALDRKSHRAKTHGGWRVERPKPGVFLWTSPLGFRYRVDDQGTHPLSNPFYTEEWGTDLPAAS